MIDPLQRVTIGDPHQIQAAMTNALRNGEARLPNYRGTDARSYRPADRRTFAIDPQDYLTRIGVSHFGSLRIARIADRRGTTCFTHDPGQPAWCLCLVQRGSVQHRGSPKLGSVTADLRHALIYRGQPGTEVTSSDDNQRLLVWIPIAKLNNSLEALLDRPATRNLVFEPAISTENGAGASIASLLGHLDRELSRTDSLLSQRIAGDLFEDLLCRSIIQGLKHNYSELLGRPHAATDLRGVRRAEEYLRAHLTEPVTLAALARAAGCSIRSLQLSFRQARGLTPMEALRRARLEQARLILASNDPGTSVTDVALRFGFSNVGRFARQYQEAFGELPKQTLRVHRL